MINSSHLKIIYETHKKKNVMQLILTNKNVKIRKHYWYEKNKSRCIFFLSILAKDFPLNDEYFVFKNINCLS